MSTFRGFQGGEIRPATEDLVAGMGRAAELEAKGIQNFAGGIAKGIEKRGESMAEAIKEFNKNAAADAETSERLKYEIGNLSRLKTIFGDNAEFQGQIQESIVAANDALKKGDLNRKAGALAGAMQTSRSVMEQGGLLQREAERRRLLDEANAELEAAASGTMEVLNAAVTTIPPVIGGREQDAYAGLRSNALILQNKYKTWDSMSRPERLAFVRTVEGFSKSLPLALQGTASQIQTGTAEALAQAAGEVSVLQGNKKEQTYAPGKWNVGAEPLSTYLAREQKNYEAKRNAAVSIAEAQGVEHDIAPWSSALPDIVRGLYSSVESSNVSAAEKASAKAALDRANKTAVEGRMAARSEDDWLLGSGDPLTAMAEGVGDVIDYLSTETPEGAVVPGENESVGQALVRSGLAAGTTVEKAELEIKRLEAERKHQAGLAAARAAALSMGSEGAEDAMYGMRVGGAGATLSYAGQGATFAAGASRAGTASAVNANAARAAQAAAGASARVTPRSVTFAGPGATVAGVQLINARSPYLTDEAGPLIGAMNEAYKAVTGENMPREGAAFGRFGYADTDPMGQLISEFNITSKISESKLAPPKKLGNETEAQFAVRKAKYEADRKAQIEAETKKVQELSKPVDRAEVYNRVLAEDGGPKKIAAPEVRVGNITLLEKRNQGEFRNALLARTRSIFPDAPRAQVEAIADSLYSPKSELQFTPLPNGGLGMIVRDKDGSIKTVTQLEKPTDPVTNAYNTGRLIGTKMTDANGNTIGYAPMNFANIVMMSGVIPDNQSYKPSEIRNGLFAASRALDLAQRRLRVYEEKGDEMTGKYSTFYDSTTAQLVNLIIEAYGIVGVQTEQDAARTYAQTQDPSQMQDGWLKTFIVQRQHSTEQGMKMLVSALSQRLADSASVNNLTIHGQIRPAFIGSADDAINLNFDPNGTAVNEASLKAEAASSGEGIMRTK